jgi:hypothetical protein
LPSQLEGEGVLGRSKLRLYYSLPLYKILTWSSLALVEMKTLLREVYSRFETTVAPDMTGSMELDDQIISSRPKGQTCKLVFSPI